MPNDLEISKKIKQLTELTYPKTSSLDEIFFFLETLSIKLESNIITIAGTNGKGSAAALCSEIFKYNHIDCISHTSPHLHRFNERITYNNQNIDNTSLNACLKLIKQTCIKNRCKLNYYQTAFFCCLLHAQRLKPKWLILEIGIGGMKDAANIIDTDIAIITNIALDHCNLLGENIEEIAFDKAHIARTNKPIVLGENIPQNAINYLKSIDAQITPVELHHEKYNLIKTPINSFNCALTAIDYINQNLDGIMLKIPNNIKNFQMNGRFSYLKKNPLVIADVAHNVSAVKTMMSKLNANYDSKIRKIFAMYATQPTKDIKKIIQTSFETFSYWLLPDLSGLDNRFLPPTENITQYLNPDNYKLFHKLEHCQNKIPYLVKKNDILIVFGSFLLVGEMISYYAQKVRIYS